MSSEEMLISVSDGKLDFGDYSLFTKAKKPDFEFNGDIYKVKTYRDITKLERNELFVYESVPGTKVTGFCEDGQEVVFCVEGYEDTQITLELEAGTEYDVFIDNTNIGRMKTNLGGKLVLSVELGITAKEVRVVKA